METAGEGIAYAATAARQMIDLYTSDLKGGDWLHRPWPKANCAAWIVGHLVLASRRALMHLGATDLPPLPDGFDKRFARDEAAPGASDFGDASVLVPLFDKHHDLLADVLRRTSSDTLNKPLENPNPRFGTVGEFAGYMALHAAMHAGQITLIRRSLGRPPLV